MPRPHLIAPRGYFPHDADCVSAGRGYIPSPAPGTKIWLTARWLNPRCQHSPSCAAVSAYLGYEVALPAILKAA